MRHGSPLLVLSAALAWANLAAAQNLRLTVDAGPHDRLDAPVRLDLDEARLAPETRAALDQGPAALALVETTGEEAPAGVAQVDRREDAGEGMARLTFILPGRTPADARRTFRLEPPEEAPAPWSIAEREPGVLELKNRERSVFRYNTSPVSHPNYGPILRRDAYIHPAFTPSGVLVTGDFSPFHPHHRGFFLAYASAHIAGNRTDFWNIHAGLGKIRFEALDASSAGPVTARLTSRHVWEAKGEGDVLRERWEVEAFDRPGAEPGWLFDLTASQRAVGDPVELRPYRYGGMAYRGPDPFVKGKLDVLTSEGLGRKDGDQKPARWVDLTGPVADGSEAYAGALIADHPSNVNHPNVARIHPTSLPFFSYVPGYKSTVVIRPESPTVFRYRVLIHDGHPDPDRDERIWRDFADPPRAVLDPAEAP